MKEVRHWNMLPREVADAHSLAVFKARLDGALNNLVWWKMSLLMAEGLEPDDLSGPFQPLPFYDSIVHTIEVTGALQASFYRSYCSIGAHTPSQVSF